jgi:hypothetical protein
MGRYQDKRGSMHTRRPSIIAAIALLLAIGLALPFIFVWAGNSGGAYLPLVVTPRTPTSQPGPTEEPTDTPNQGGDLQIPVGPGYTDVSPKQLVRTSANRLYVIASNCDNYPCTDISQTLRAYRSTTSGAPDGFTRADTAHEPGGVAGWAIAIDGSDLIHVVWTDRTASGSQINRLRYTTFNTASNTWGGTVETIDGSLNVSLDSGGQGVQSVALALDAGGVPHVVYLKGTNRRAYYRNRTGGTWGPEAQIDSAVSYSNDQKAWHPNLAFDTDGRILAVWQQGSFNAANDGTIYGRVRETNGDWGALTNISGTNTSRVIIDQSTSLVITPDNHYHIVWLAASTDNIRYQYSTDLGASWQTNSPGGGTQATHNPSLGYAAGKLRIYGHGTPVPIDGHGDDLFFFEGDGGTAAWGTWTKFVTGMFDSSINTRWSQYFHSFPNTVDLAYWADPYPNELFVATQDLAP